MIIKELKETLAKLQSKYNISDDDSIYFILTNGQTTRLGDDEEMQIDKDGDITIKITYYE